MSKEMKILFSLFLIVVGRANCITPLQKMPLEIGSGVVGWEVLASSTAMENTDKKVYAISLGYSYGILATFAEVSQSKMLFCDYFLQPLGVYTVNQIGLFVGLRSNYKMNVLAYGGFSQAYVQDLNKSFIIEMMGLKVFYGFRDNLYIGMNIGYLIMTDKDYIINASDLQYVVPFFRIMFGINLMMFGSKDGIGYTLYDIKNTKKNGF